MAVMASLACYGLRDLASYTVPVMGKSQFSFGLSTFLSFCYQSFGWWIELPLSCCFHRGVLLSRRRDLCLWLTQQSTW